MGSMPGTVKKGRGKFVLAVIRTHSRTREKNLLVTAEKREPAGGRPASKDDRDRLTVVGTRFFT
jgi:hypothetical protein